MKKLLTFPIKVTSGVICLGLGPFLAVWGRDPISQGTGVAISVAGATTLSSAYKDARESIN